MDWISRRAPPHPRPDLEAMVSEGLILLLGLALLYSVYRLGYYTGRKRALAEFTLDTYENWQKVAHEKDKKPLRPFS